MKTVIVKKQELLNKISENRKNHAAAYESATKAYRKRAIEELERAIADARSGNRIIQRLSLPVPEDHTADYDAAITALEMETREEIEIDQHEFRTYVMDEWGWLQSFRTTTMSYND